MDRPAEAALAWLVEQDAPESAIAAHEHGRTRSKEAARRWVRRILDQERDGGWSDGLLATATALITLHELRRAATLKEQDPAIGRALDWIRARQGRPGAWTDGCSEARHAGGFCHHFAGGFFSAGSPYAQMSPVELPSGAGVVGDGEIRFVASAVALRCTLLWRGRGTDAGLHLAVLRPLVTRWAEAPPSGLSTTGLLCAVRALVHSPDERDREAAEAGLRVVAGKQRGDGSWLDADPFHALAVFVEAAEVGVGGKRAADALDYGARLLRASQREDGSWGPEHGARRALIALRTMRRS